MNKKDVLKCSLSKGENAISLWLNRNGIEFSVQYPMKNIDNKSTLRYDFFVPNKNLLIEYDGQHFLPVKFGGMSDEKASNLHNLIKKRDKIKNQLAKKNGFNLLRINYKEDTIKKLNKYFLVSNIVDKFV